VPYFAQRPVQHETLAVRGLQFQLYRWPSTDPQPASPTTILLHGWGETWQFVVDHLSPGRTLLAFDARGFGRTQWPADGYWFPDYLADLEAILDHESPHAAVDLVGHSMGGNVAMLYAGVRPERVRRLISLEGFGLPRTAAVDAPQRYREWLDDLKRGTPFSMYDSFEQFVSVLARRNPRTGADHLDFIARSWGRQRADGRVELRADPRHKQVSPALYQRDQAEACWREITAVTHLLIGDQSELARRMGEELKPEILRPLFRELHCVTLPGAGHMMHHEQPQAVAELIESLLR
jgi:pimeloyl-ACP methyl ester carboxylesterase